MGDGKKIRFWEDIWFGTSPLSVQFWPLYSICHQHCVTLAEVWDNVEIKLTFRRVLTTYMMEQWYCLEQIILVITYTDWEDALIWQYEAKGKYTTGSLYSIINLEGLNLSLFPQFGLLWCPQECRFSYGFYPTINL